MIKIIIAFSLLANISIASDTISELMKQSSLSYNDYRKINDHYEETVKKKNISDSQRKEIEEYFEFLDQQKSREKRHTKSDKANIIYYSIRSNPSSRKFLPLVRKHTSPLSEFGSYTSNIVNYLKLNGDEKDLESLASLLGSKYPHDRDNAYKAIMRITRRVYIKKKVNPKFNELTCVLPKYENKTIELGESLLADIVKIGNPSNKRTIKEVPQLSLKEVEEIQANFRSIINY